MDMEVSPRMEMEVSKSQDGHRGKSLDEHGGRSLNGQGGNKFVGKFYSFLSFFLNQFGMFYISLGFIKVLLKFMLTGS